MNVYIWINLLLIIIIIYIVYNKFNMKKKLSEEIEFKSNQIKKLDYKLENMIRIKEIYTLNINNIENALKFYNEKTNKKYIYTYEIKDPYFDDIKQQIAIVMFEDEIVYNCNYFKDNIQPCDIKNIDKYKQYFDLRCRVFVDGTSIDPILLKKLYMNDKNTVIIEDINLNKLCGRGIGTYIIKILEIILPQYGVKEIKAPISSVDFHKRDRLKNFYCGINGFNMVKEVTEEKWGLAVKNITNDNS
ncbi:hypothetical protein [Clostridium perfringens]|uniref:hypothetical protein n=1 Tax=Clostridium perfringens TaxID=1502 RepID=UPI00321AC75C